MAAYKSVIECRFARVLGTTLDAAGSYGGFSASGWQPKRRLADAQKKIIMKSPIIAMLAVGFVLAITATGGASVNFLADSNQFGYQGTVQNLTLGTPAVALPTPRDAMVYYTSNVPILGYTTNYNVVSSNWTQSPESNQNAGFFQIYDNGGSVTSATGGWTKDGSLWDFTLTITGQNATYASAISRLYQPDADISWGGTYTNYTYTITATGMPTAVADGWQYNTADPASITGSFVGTYVSTFDAAGNPIANGDTYQADLTFSNAYYDGTDWVDGGYGFSSTFGDPMIPEPPAIVVWSLLGLVAMGFGLKRAKRDRSQRWGRCASIVTAP